MVAVNMFFVWEKTIITNPTPIFFGILFIYFDLIKVRIWFKDLLIGSL